MFRSFVRMLGLGGETGRTSKVGVRDFSPRLEALDGRELPSTMTLAAGFDVTPAAVRSVDHPTPPIWVGIGGGAAGGVVGSGHSTGGVDNYGGLSGGVIASGRAVGGVDNFGGLSGGVIASGGAAGGIVGSGHSSGGVEIYGGLSGGVIGDRTGMVSLDGGASGGVIGDRTGMVSLDGGASGGVIGDRAGMVSLQWNVEESITRSSGEEIPQ